MQIEDIRKGDIITYRSGKINYVNKPFKYAIWFDKDFKHKRYSFNMNIIKIQRYVKFLCFYRLKTIYEREQND